LWSYLRYLHIARSEAKEKIHPYIMNQAHGFKKALTFFFRAVGSRHFVTPDFNPATFEIKTEFHRNEPFNQRNTLFINDGLTEYLLSDPKNKFSLAATFTKPQSSRKLRYNYYRFFSLFFSQFKLNLNKSKIPLANIRLRY
jgi:hypothetical protein